MTRRAYVNALGQALRPMGFTRAGGEWVRIRGELWESVHPYSSRTDGTVTVSLYIKDLETEKLFLEIFGPTGAIQMPARDAAIGGLIDGYDRWWKPDDPDGPAAMVDAVLTYGLPWFDRVRTLEEQATAWYARPTAVICTGYNGPALIGLALTLYRMGEFDEARAVLRKPVTRTAIKSSVENVARARDWLDRKVGQSA